MKNLLKILLGGLFLCSFYSVNAVAKDVNVAFFLEWATPNQEAKVKKTYDDAMGVNINWTNFATGVEMTEAMLSGDIDISYSQGMTPFVNAVNAKAPIKIVDVAVEYGMGGTGCVVSNASGITKANASELEGQKVAVPLNTMADYAMRMISAHLGTLFAVSIYFWQDFKNYLIFGPLEFFKKKKTFNFKLFLNLVCSSIPIIILGAFLKLQNINYCLTCNNN